MKKKLKTLKQNNKKGFTLIEIIVSIAIIGILAVALLSVFTSGYSTIFSMGRKTESSNEAQAFIERVYQEGIADINSIAIDFNSNTVVDSSQMNSGLYDQTEPDKVMFHNVNSSGDQPKVTVLVFYENGRRNVKVSALVR